MGRSALQDLTVVVPLKDNVERTARFIENAMCPWPQFFFADGSYGSGNEELLAAIELENVTYMRFEPDRDLRAFASKMVSVFEQVQTPYALICDSGDYPIWDGVLSCIELLNSRSDLSCAGGDIYKSYEFGRYLSPPRRVMNPSPISSMPAEQALAAISKSYAYNYYSVFRTDIWFRVWSLILENGLRHPYREYLPMVLALSVGPIGNPQRPSHLRIAHGPLQWTEGVGDVVESRHLGFAEMLRFAEMVEKETQLPSHLVVSAFRENADLVTRRHGRTASNALRINNALARVSLPTVLGRFLRPAAIRHYAGMVVSYKKVGDGFRLLVPTLDGLRLRHRPAVLDGLAQR